jgi:hypothetical protein
MVFPKRDKKEVIAYEDNISLSNSEETESEIFTESEDY